MLRTVLMALLLAAPLAAVAAPTASAHVCIEGTRDPGCDQCPNLGLFHSHPDGVAGVRFASAVCVLP